MIKKVRQRKELTQRELSKRSGFSETYISEVENGRETCSIAGLFILCQTLEVKLSVVLHNAELRINQ